MPDWVKSAVKGALIMAGVALLFAWFGVYGTRELPFVPRFGLWYVTMLIGGGTGALLIPWVRRGRTGKWPVAFQVILTAAFVSVPITMAILPMMGGELWLERVFIQYGYVFVVSLVLTAIGWLHGMLEETSQEARQVCDPVASFLERLPVKFRTAELYALSAEDHYLRVHTNMGEELILMRLSDALRELAGADGLQIHRSWWVSRNGVADSHREDGKQVLILKSGGRAPVSRTYAGLVKKAGLA